MSKRNIIRRWRISRVGGPRQQYVTMVLAPDEAAIATVTKENEIKDAWEQAASRIARKIDAVRRALRILQRCSMDVRRAP